MHSHAPLLAPAWLLFYPVQYDGEEYSKNLFYTGAAPNQQAIPATDYYLKELGIQKFALLGTDYVYLSILTQAMTLTLSRYLFQDDSGLHGNNGLSGLQNLPGLADMPQQSLSLWFLWASAAALALAYITLSAVISGKFGSVIRAIRDDETRLRVLGYCVESYKIFVLALTAVITAIAGALYYPQAGIINPAELAPTASIYLAVWLAIGRRDRLYRAVIGAAFVSLRSSWFTGCRAPAIPLGFYTINWVDWRQVLLGLSFVAVILFAPEGSGGLFDRFQGRPPPDRKGADLGPEQGLLQEQEAVE